MRAKCLWWKHRHFPPINSDNMCAVNMVNLICTIFSFHWKLCSCQQSISYLYFITTVLVWRPNSMYSQWIWTQVLCIHREFERQTSASCRSPLLLFPQHQARQGVVETNDFIGRTRRLLPNIPEWLFAAYSGPTEMHEWIFGKPSLHIRPRRKCTNLLATFLWVAISDAVLYTGINLYLAVVSTVGPP